jgi:hypothetical protein
MFDPPVMGKEGVMPKEIIKSEMEFPDEEPFQIEVRWNKEGYEPTLQVATTDPSADLFSRESGLFVDLDRNKVNQLIRILRKARDQNFGRDE